ELAGDRVAVGRHRAPDDRVGARAAVEQRLRDELAVDGEVAVGGRGAVRAGHDDVGAELLDVLVELEHELRGGGVDDVAVGRRRADELAVRQRGRRGEGECRRREERGEGGEDRGAKKTMGCHEAKATSERDDPRRRASWPRAVARSEGERPATPLRWWGQPEGGPCPSPIGCGCTAARRTSTAPTSWLGGSPSWPPTRCPSTTTSST